MSASISVRMFGTRSATTAMLSTSTSPTNKHLLPHLHLLAVVIQTMILRSQPLRMTKVRALRATPTPTNPTHAADVLMVRTVVAEGPADTLPSLSTLSLLPVIAVTLKLMI